MGSDDPDINDTAADDQPKPKKSSQTTEPIQTIDESRNLRKTEAEIKHLNDPAENQLESISALDPKAPEFALPSVPLQSERVVSNGSAAYCNPMVTNCNAEVTSLDQSCTTSSLLGKDGINYGRLKTKLSATQGGTAVHRG